MQILGLTEGAVPAKMDATYYNTLTYQNLLCCRVPIISILECIIRTYKKVHVGFGRLR